MSRPYKQASCLFCKEKFDRNKIPFIVVSTAPRYIHASCAKGYAKKTKKVLDEPINPATHSVCEFCHKAVPTDEAVKMSGDRFAHRLCHAKSEAKDGNFPKTSCNSACGLVQQNPVNAKTEPGL